MVVTALETPATRGVAAAREERFEFFVAEHASLRSEILKHLELQAQLISLNVIILGVILSFGVQADNPVVILIYPLLSLILGISWLNHSHAITRCAAYLSQELEPRLAGDSLGWENYVRRHPLRYSMLGYWGIRSIFMGSSVAAVAAGIVLLQDSTTEIIFIICSCIITGITIIIFLIWREPSPHRILAEDLPEATRKATPAV